MRYMAACLILAGLSACGVDGEPVRPTANATVTLTNNGPILGAAVGLRKGPLAIRLGL